MIGPWLFLLLVGIPPLTAAQQVRLETARDGGDHREAAFVALVEHARSWTGRLGDASIRLHPDVEAMAAAPARWRGELCRIRGAVQQQTPLARPHQGVSEWFVRDDAGRPILVYVVDVEGSPAARFRDGAAIVVDARYYKTVGAVARDGRSRRYPAFVGAWPRAARPASRGAAHLGAVATAVAVLLVAFLLLLVYTRRQRRERPPPVRRGRGRDAEPPAATELPEDPAEALAELERRSENAER